MCGGRGDEVESDGLWWRGVESRGWWGMGEVRGETERKQGEEEVEGGRGEVEESGERVKSGEKIKGNRGGWS